MAVLGARAAIDLAMPSTIDASRVFNFQMRNGKTGPEIISEAAAVIGAVNEEIMRRWGGLIYITDAPYSYYRQGTTGQADKTPKKVEFKIAEAVRGSTGGHMLVKEDYEDALGWTPLYLRDAFDAQVTADLDEIGSRWRNRVETDVLTRMFSNAVNAVGSGYDVPWAIGSGTAPYQPPSYSSNTFDTTHTHFKFTSTGSIDATKAAALLELMVGEMVHHEGLQGRYVAIVSSADVASYAGMTGFVKFIPTDVQVVAGGSAAPVYIAPRELEGMPGEIFGFYLSARGPVVELRAEVRVPTGYAWMGKSFGQNAPRNPIAVREHPGIGFGLRTDPQLTTSLQPELAYLLFKATHGVGVNDRLNGVAGKIGASYTAPTIS
jgi:hypothetical protein